ncbi:MAG: SseB family protein, partial [Solobacterium sp.]|nr:SseB family protein [Solobacterium sp.]
MSKKKKQKNKVSKVSGTSVSNPALKKAMLDLKEGSTPEKQNALSMALVKAKFLVPCKVEEVQPGIAAVKYMMMNTNEGAAYFPIFTDQKEADRFAGGEVQPQFIVRTLKDYAEMLEKQENVAGLVVNPGEDSL